MRLMHPSPGEAYDRMTILNLKIMAAEKKGMEAAKITFGLELEALGLYMQDKHYNVPTNLGTELAKINARLWDLEDAQRKILREGKNGISSDTMQTDFFNNAITIVELNDLRAATVQKINAACNVDQPEKLYDSQ